MTPLGYVLTVGGATALIWGGAVMMNRAEAKRRKQKAPPEPTAGATVRWTRSLYTAAVHRSAAPAGQEPGFTWGVWLTADVLAAGNSLDAASATGKKLIDGPADDYKAAVAAANAWIDAKKGKLPTEYPKPPVPTPTPTPEPTAPDPGDIGWYTRGPFTVVTWFEEIGGVTIGSPQEPKSTWSWAVFRTLQVIVLNQDWARLFAEKLEVARGPADNWFDARQAANAWVDEQLVGEAVKAPAKPDEVVAYPPAFFAEVAGLPLSLMPPEDGLVELSSKVPGADDCGAILVGPLFWERAGEVANWLWDNGQHDTRAINRAILDEFTTKCRTANTPAALAFRIELGKHLAELKAYKEQ